MHPRTTHLVWPSAALSLLAGCLLEVTPEPPPPPPPPPPPGVVADLEGQLLDAEGRPAQFVPVQLDGQGGPMVATDERGIFVFPDVAEGEHNVYAFDPFTYHIAVGNYYLLSEVGYSFIIQLEDCDEALRGDPSDIEIINICSYGLDMPPSVQHLTINRLEYANGNGETNPFNTSASIGFDEGELRGIIFSMRDGLGRGGVRELTVENHLMVGAPPGVDPFGEPLFLIVTRDRHGQQRYAVRDGVFRIEVAEGDSPTRSFVLTGTDLVLDYGEANGPFDPAYTLTVNTLRLEGTVEVKQPPPPPPADLTLPASAIPFIGAGYSAGRETLELSMIGDPALHATIMLDPAQLPLPGAIDVVLPIGDVPDRERDWLSMYANTGSPTDQWDFQLVSYTVSTEMTELPDCNERLQITLENVVFRYVGWDYDENGDYVESFGDQTLTIERLDIDEPVSDETPGAC